VLTALRDAARSAAAKDASAACPFTLALTTRLKTLKEDTFMLKPEATTDTPIVLDDLGQQTVLGRPWSFGQRVPSAEGAFQAALEKSWLQGAPAPQISVRYSGPVEGDAGGLMHFLFSVRGNRSTHATCHAVYEDFSWTGSYDVDTSGGMARFDLRGTVTEREDMCGKRQGPDRVTTGTYKGTVSGRGTNECAEKKR
jgi:hypothetical protein